MIGRPCSSCGRPFGKQWFHRDRRSSTGYGGKCKACISVYQAGRADHRRWNRIMARYGLSQGEYMKLLDINGLGCGICASTDAPAFASGVPIWNVDHCHHSGRVRGLLCGACNSGLGFLGDTSDSVSRAVDYLRRAEAVA